MERRRDYMSQDSGLQYSGIGADVDETQLKQSASYSPPDQRRGSIHFNKQTSRQHHGASASGTNKSDDSSSVSSEQSGLYKLLNKHLFGNKSKKKKDDIVPIIHIETLIIHPRPPRSHAEPDYYNVASGPEPCISTHNEGYSSMPDPGYSYPQRYPMQHGSSASYMSHPVWRTGEMSMDANSRLTPDSIQMSSKTDGSSSQQEDSGIVYSRIHKPESTPAVNKMELYTEIGVIDKNSKEVFAKLSGNDDIVWTGKLTCSVQALNTSPDSTTYKTSAGTEIKTATSDIPLATSSKGSSVFTTTSSVVHTDKHLLGRMTGSEERSDVQTTSSGAIPKDSKGGPSRSGARPLSAVIHSTSTTNINKQTESVKSDDKINSSMPSLQYSEQTLNERLSFGRKRAPGIPESSGTRPVSAVLHTNGAQYSFPRQRSPENPSDRPSMHRITEPTYQNYTPPFRGDEPYRTGDASEISASAPAMITSRNLEAFHNPEGRLRAMVNSYTEIASHPMPMPPSGQTRGSLSNTRNTCRDLECLGGGYHDVTDENEQAHIRETLQRIGKIGQWVVMKLEHHPQHPFSLCVKLNEDVFQFPIMYTSKKKYKIDPKVPGFKCICKLILHYKTKKLPGHLKYNLANEFPKDRLPNFMTYQDTTDDMNDQFVSLSAPQMAASAERESTFL